MIRKSVEFKGTKEGILLVLDSECEFEEIFDGLKKKVDQGRNFFSGATIVGTEGRTLTKKEREKLEDYFADVGIQVERLDFIERLRHNSNNRKNKETVTVDETETVSSVVLQKPVVSVVQKPEDAAKIIFGTLRSGKNITYPGHVVVVGDVNPGAEIIAEGHIVIMGTLRGVAHAGSAGDSSATITAIRLNPTQLRIGKLITRPPEGVKPPDIPEMAKIKDGMIIIEPCL